MDKSNTLELIRFILKSIELIKTRFESITLIMISYLMMMG